MNKSVFTPGRILITAIVIFVLTIVNVVAYYVLGSVYKSVNESQDNPYQELEKQLDSYPVYKGIVKEIKYYDKLGALIEQGEPEEPVFTNTDSVRVGDYYIADVYINIDGRWFYSDKSIHVWDSISDSGSGIDISVGSVITVAYGRQDSVDGYDFIYAIKPNDSRSASSSAGYIFFVLIPSVLVLILSLLLIYLGNRSRVLRIVSIVLLILTVIFSLFSTFCITSYLKKAKQAAKAVRTHSAGIYLYNASPDPLTLS